MRLKFRMISMNHKHFSSIYMLSSLGSSDRELCGNEAVVGTGPGSLTAQFKCQLCPLAGCDCGWITYPLCFSCTTEKWVTSTWSFGLFWEERRGIRVMHSARCLSCGGHSMKAGELRKQLFYRQGNGGFAKVTIAQSQRQQRRSQDTNPGSLALGTGQGPSTSAASPTADTQRGGRVTLQFHHAA